MSGVIRIQVRKKIEVPTNAGSKHPTRFDFKDMGMITPMMSPEFFKCINGTGLLSTDAQMALWLVRQFGEGEYMCLAWKKYQKGFWNFLHVVCFDDRFKRVQKGMSAEQKEAREQMVDFKRLQAQLRSAEDDVEKEEIIGEMRSTEDMLSVNKEIVKLSKGQRRGPYPYLKSTQPVFKEHEYEEYLTENMGETVNQGGFWG